MACPIGTGGRRGDSPIGTCGRRGDSPIGTGGRRGDSDVADDAVVGGLPSSILAAIRYSDHTHGSKVYAVPIAGISILQVTTSITTITAITTVTDEHVSSCFFLIILCHLSNKGGNITEGKGKGRDVRLRICSNLDV